MGESKLFAVLVVMLFATCGDPAGPGNLGEGCVFPDLGTSGWELVERPGFSFRLPPGFEKQDLQPIDSDAAIYRSDDGSTLSHDFGYYSGTIDPGEADCTTRIGGHDARIVVVNTAGERHVAAYWPDLPDDGPGLGDGLSLRMDGEAANAEVLAHLMAAIASVEIE